MPLSKKRMRARKRQDRATVKPMSNLKAEMTVKPKIPGLIMEGNRIIGVQPKPLIGTPWIDDIAEFVDSASEDLDADGNRIYEER